MSRRYYAQTGLTYWSADTMERIYSGEQVPVEERGEQHRVEKGEEITSEVISIISPSLNWLVEQGLVKEEILEDPEDTIGEELILDGGEDDDEVFIG